MKKLILAFTIFLSVCGYGYTATYNAASCNVNDIQHEHDVHAAIGDTISVPAGNCTWSAALKLSKNVKLIGAGAALVGAACDGSTKTCITSNITPIDYISETTGNPTWAGDDNYMIYYGTSTLADASYTFEISGFTFDSDDKSGLIYLNNLISANDYSSPISISIHNNIFYTHYNTLATYFETLMTTGPFYGVWYSNVNYGPYDMNIQARGRYSWDNLSPSLGSSNALYIEDNTFYVDATGSNTGSGAFEIGAGASGVFRYNSIFKTTTKAGTTTLGGQNHGNASGTTPIYAGMVAEMYGNYVEDTSTNISMIMNIRGGWNALFYNRYKTTDAMYQFKEYETYSPGSGADTGSPTDTACPNDGMHLYPTSGTGGTGINSCGKAPNYQPQHVWNNYAWANKVGKTGNGSEAYFNIYPTSVTPERQIVNNTHLFSAYQSSCSTTGGCSTGVGCGTTLPSSCTTGTGYWLTSQSCTVLDSYVGVNPAAPISGILYICSTTDVWSTYYTPYTYPHPLREQTDTLDPIPYDFTPTTEQVCTASPYASVSVGLKTNENATCKWDTTVDGTPTYAELANTFTGSGSTTHTSTIANLDCGQTATIYYACLDSALNASDVTSSQFPIASGGDTVGPVNTNLTVSTQQFSFLGQLLSIRTDKPATCRYCADCATDTAWADRAQFGITGDTEFHAVNVGQPKSSTVAYEILCVSTQGYYSTNTEASITTTDHLGMAVNDGSLTGTIQDTNTVNINF